MKYNNVLLTPANAPIFIDLGHAEPHNQWFPLRELARRAFCLAPPHTVDYDFSVLNTNEYDDMDIVIEVLRAHPHLTGYLGTQATDEIDVFARLYEAKRVARARGYHPPESLGATVIRATAQ